MQASTPFESGTRPLVKKGRPTTSCTECFRRKQKCNRKNPCNNCSARNVARRCVYSRSLLLRSLDSNLSLDEPTSGTHISSDDRSAAVLSNGMDHVPNSSQLGYSSVAGSNAFVELEQVFKDGNDFQSIQAAHNRSPTPPFQPCTEALLLISRLPPKPVTDELIAAFFLDVNWHYFIVEEFYFNDLFSRWYSEPSPLTYLTRHGLSQEMRYFPTLLFQILALSLQFLPPGAAAWRFFESETSPSQKYSDTGVKLMKVLGEQGIALSAIQASLLRASWLKNLGRGIDAWRFLGNAIRQSQELGLHRQQSFYQPISDSVEESLALFWYTEYKKRVWINLYAWDSLMALVLGRPMVISDFDCDTNIPIDCDIPNCPSRTPPMTLSADSDRNRPTSPSASLVRYFISTKVHELRALGLDRPHPRDYSMVNIIHEQVLRILDNTKPVLRPQSPDTSWDAQFPYLCQQREELLTIVYTFLMALHRPHIRTHMESRRAILRATIAVLDSQQRLFDLTKTHHYGLCHLSFYTVDAAILLSVATALYPQESLEGLRNIHRALQQCMARLSVMAPFNPTAKSGLDIIQRCYWRLQETCESSSWVDAIPAPTPPTGAQLQNTQEALSHERLSYTGCVAGESTTNCFDEFYWLQQVDDIYSDAYVSNLDPILEQR